MSTQFDKLLAELATEQTATETIAKSLPADGEGDDDTKIEAAAGDEGAGAKVDGDEDKKGDDKKVVAKSLKVIDGEGNEHDAIDGEELIKSLDARISGMEANTVKSLDAVFALVKSQGAIIKSMSEGIAKMRLAPAGRKAVLTVTEKKEQGAEKKESGITADAFMAKAMVALSEGRLGANDIAVCENLLHNRQELPAGLVARVMQPA